MDCRNYINIRDQIKDGDMLLYHGKSLLAKSIQYFDDAHFNHIGIAKWVGKRLFTIEMWNKGIDFIPLSRRMNTYIDFSVIRPNDVNPKLIQDGLDATLGLFESDEQYDYLMLLRIAILKKTGVNLVNLKEKNTFICSELAQYFCNQIGVTCYEKISPITPQDFIRHIYLNQITIFAR
jgi:hypothetical protein